MKKYLVRLNVLKHREKKKEKKKEERMEHRAA